MALDRGEIVDRIERVLTDGVEIGSGLAQVAAVAVLGVLAPELRELELLQRYHLVELPMRDAIRHELILQMGAEIGRLESEAIHLRGLLAEKGVIA